MVAEEVIIVMVILLIAMFAPVVVYDFRYKRLPPDKAMVVYGRQMRPGSKIGYRAIAGGGKFVLPIIEDVKFLDLGLKEVVFEIDNLRTDPKKEASLVRLELIALYRISAEPSGVHVASEHLMDKTPEDIKRITETLIRGHVRGIVATMTPTDVDLHRDKVEKIFQTQAAADLLNIGIEVLTFRIIKVHQKGVD